MATDDSCEGGGSGGSGGTPSFLGGTGFEVGAAITASPVPSIQASSFGSFPTCGGQLGIAASLALARLLPNLLCDMPLGTAEPDDVASDSDGPTIIDESFGSLPSCGGSEPFMMPNNQLNTLKRNR